MDRGQDLVLRRESHETWTDLVLRREGHEAWSDLVLKQEDHKTSILSWPCTDERVIVLHFELTLYWDEMVFVLHFDLVFRREGHKFWFFWTNLVLRRDGHYYAFRPCTKTRGS